MPLNRHTLYTQKSSRFIQCGTKVFPFILFQDAWRDLVHPIDIAMIAWHQCDGHEVHPIIKSRTWLKTHLSESIITVDQIRYNG